MPVAFKGKSPITALELDTNFVKLCQAQSKKGKKILKLFISRLEPSQNISTQVDRIIKKSKISIANLVVIIPREQIIVRSLRLPSADEYELSQMMEFQLRQQVPYPKEHMVVDHIILNRYADGSSLVMFAAARKETIHKYISLFDNLRYRPQVVTLSSLGITNWYNCAAAKALQGTVLLLDIDYNYAEILLIKDGNFLFTRGISISDDKELLLSELARTIIQLKKENIAESLNGIVLTGGVDKFGDLEGLLKDRFSVPTEKIPPAQNFILQDIKTYNEYNHKDVSVTSVIGAALSNNRMLINLVPRDTLNEWDSKLKKTHILRSLAIIAGIFLCLALAYTRDRYETGAYARYLDTEIKKTQGEVSQLQDMTKRLEFIKQELDKKTILPDIISALYTITPSNVRLLDFVYEENEKVNIRANCRSMSDVFEFSNKLDKLPYFKGVRIRYVSEKKMSDASSVLDFELICQLN